MKPVEFKDYGCFCSFGPVTDSNSATFSAAESTNFIRPNRSVEYLPYNPVITIPDSATAPIFDGSSPCKDYKTLDILSETDQLSNGELKIKDLKPIENLDWNEILHLPKKIKAHKEHNLPNPSFVGHLLNQNMYLVDQLSKFQIERYRRQSHKISELEDIAVKTLVENLTTIIKWTKPEDLIDNMDLDAGIKMVKLYESSYHGTLYSKLQSINTNYLGPKSFS
ncbi:hypothetical protein BC833DRAFT_581907 [Globomyces pollinis-pini]|nr:hypothetical protein BC833DRAFT_581907 [Globomyces pollinis-pini]